MPVWLHINYYASTVYFYIMKWPEDGLILVETCCPVFWSVSSINKYCVDGNKVLLYNVSLIDLIWVANLEEMCALCPLFVSRIDSVWMSYTATEFKMSAEFVSCSYTGKHIQAIVSLHEPT